MKITVFADLLEEPTGGYSFPIMVGKGTKAKTIRLTFGGPDDREGRYDPDQPEPRNVLPGVWAFHRKTVRVEDAAGFSSEEVILRVKHAVLREEKALARIQMEVDAFENMGRALSARRERIPESVRLFVWQRDEGK
jgi:hypothetical protein